MHIMRHNAIIINCLSVNKIVGLQLANTVWRGTYIMQGRGGTQGGGGDTALNELY